MPSDASGDLLDLPAKRGRLHALAGAGLLDAEALERSLAAIDLRPTRASWSAYLYWNALIVGVVLLVSGTIFFVAANWSALSGFTKMGIVGAMMVAATLAGGYLGDTLAGRATTLLGGLLFGPLLAVYGQVYQTGADAWELFAWWSVVLVAYGVATRFVGAWVVALIGVHVAWLAWIAQEIGGSPFEHAGARLVAGLAVFDAAVVVLAELVFEPERPALRRILTHVAASFGLMLVLPFAALAIFDELPDGGGLGIAVLVAGMAAIWIVYRGRRPEVGMLAAFATVATILITTVFARLIFEGLDAELFGVAALGVIVCAQVWGFTRWLLAWRREHINPDRSTATAAKGGEA